MSKRMHGLAVSVVGAALALGCAAVWAGCSGSVVTVPATAGEGGPPDSGVGTQPVPVTDAQVSDATLPSMDGALPPKDAGPGSFPGDAAGIKCGATICGGAQVCCESITDGGGTAACAAACTDGGFTVACDGPEDCTGGAGNLCCADFKVGAGTGANCPIVSAAAACTATCNTKLEMACPGDSTVRLCHKLADCANEPSGATGCCQVSRFGQTATFCLDPAFAQFIPGAICL